MPNPIAVSRVAREVAAAGQAMANLRVDGREHDGEEDAGEDGAEHAAEELRGAADQVRVRRWSAPGLTGVLHHECRAHDRLRDEQQPGPGQEASVQAPQHQATEDHGEAEGHGRLCARAERRGHGPLPQWQGTPNECRASWKKSWTASALRTKARPLSNSDDEQHHKHVDDKCPRPHRDRDRGGLLDLSHRRRWRHAAHPCVSTAGRR